MAFQAFRWTKGLGARQSWKCHDFVSSPLPSFRHVSYSSASLIPFTAQGDFASSAVSSTSSLISSTRSRSVPRTTHPKASAPNSPVIRRARKGDGENEVSIWSCIKKNAYHQELQP